MFNNQALLEEEGAAPDQGAGAPVGLGAFDFRTHRSAQIGKPGEDAHEVCAAPFGCVHAGPCNPVALTNLDLENDLHGMHCRNAG